MVSRLEAYQSALHTVRVTSALTLKRAEVTSEALKWTSYTLGALKLIENNAEAMRKLAAGLETVSKLLSKVGPIKPLMTPLTKLIGEIEDRAKQLEDKAEDLDSLFGPKKKRVDDMKKFVDAEIIKLKAQVQEADSVIESIDDAVAAINLAHLPDYAADAVEAAHDTILPVDTDLINTLAASMQDAADNLEQVVRDVLAPAKAISDVYKKIQSIVSNLDFLSGPLDVVADVIRPIQWALDAVDYIFNLVVSPVLDPVLAALGFDKFVENIMKKLGLPSLNPFTAIEEQLNKVFDALEVDVGLADIFLDKVNAFIDEIEGPGGLFDVLVFDGSENGELVVGDDVPDIFDDTATSSNGLDGLGGHDLVAGGEGDDTLRGGAGNDILVGGKGDDDVDGGEGQDTAVLLANFADFNFSWNGDTSTLIATHTGTVHDRGHQGTDSIRNVAVVAFLDMTVEFSRFGEIRYSGSEPDLPPVLLEGDPDGVPNRDFLIGGDGIDTINGKAGDDYIEGRDGFDQLNGGSGNDWINGGAGRDYIDGGTGIDTAVFNPGDGSIANFNHVDLLRDETRRPFIPNETIINIENLSGGAAHDWFWGDNAANRLDGKGGADKLVGFDGNDTILGGEGDDQIVGGRGNDRLSGGAGYDLYIQTWGNDTISDSDGRGEAWYGGGMSWAYFSAYAAQGIETTAFVSLAEVGFTPEDLLSDLPGWIQVNMVAGRVMKWDADGIHMGTDVIDVTTVVGSVGDDLFFGSVAGEQLHGGAGNDWMVSEDALNGDQDTFVGGEGNDTINPGEGSANAYGGEGDDLFIVDDVSYNLIHGNEGFDWIDFSDSDRTWIVSLYGFQAIGALDEAATDTDFINLTNVEGVILSNQDDRIKGYLGNGHFIGGLGNDYLEGASASETLAGDTLEGGEGFDTLVGGTWDDLALGGADNDLFIGGLNGIAGGEDTYRGGAGNDIFRPIANGRYLIDGGDGVDEVDFSGWQGALWFSTGTDLSQFPDSDVVISNIEIIRGASFGDTIYGGFQANKYIGEDGDDHLMGRAGDDVLHGNSGDDTLDGGADNDLLFGGIGNNLLIGGSGTDSASWDPQMEGEAFDENGKWVPNALHGTLSADLMAATGAFTRDSDGSLHSSQLLEIENIIGTANDDLIRGDRFGNSLTGGEGTGADDLAGRGGDDTLTGGAGDDRMLGDHEAGAVNMAFVNEAGATDGYIGMNGLPLPAGGRATVEFMIQSTVPSDDYMALLSYSAAHTQGGSNNHFLLEARADGQTRLARGTSYWDTNVHSSEYLDGALHRFSFTFDAATGWTEFYLDGKLRATSNDAQIARAFRSEGFLTLGQEQDSYGGSFAASQVFRGGYGDFRIFDTIRDQKQIEDNWDGALADPANVANLVGYWSADETTASMMDMLGTTGDMASVGSVRFADIGTSGNDLLMGEQGNDDMDGGAGNDTLLGGEGADLMTGGAGNDRLEGETGADVMAGGAGDDVLIGETVDQLVDPVFAQLYRLYNAALGRDPDPDGHRAWMNRLTDENSESTLKNVATNFVNSAEFRNIYGDPSNGDFVHLLYNNVLGRHADETGFAIWKKQLDTGAMTRAELVLRFSESVENKWKTEAFALEFSEAGYQMNWSDEVFRLFQATLDRAPGVEGLKEWALRLAEGMSHQEAVDGFVKSAEFIARYGNTTDSEFVTLLYRNVLDREPDTTGLTTWTNQLAGGAMTRAEVVLRFAESRESVNKFTPLLKDWMRSAGEDDRIEGNGGQNILFGGIMTDRFIFNASEGSVNKVAEFEAWDMLEFRDFGYADAAEARSHMSVNADGVTFQDQGVRIDFLGADMGRFTDDVFEFV
ncbi:MAG: DUF4214 domain-containing protein [Pseudooceanicola sp.]